MQLHDFLQQKRYISLIQAAWDWGDVYNLEMSITVGVKSVKGSGGQEEHSQPSKKVVVGGGGGGGGHCPHTIPDYWSFYNSSGPPSAPTLSCVELTEDVSGTVNVTVNWTLSGGDSADFYLINITTNAPGLLNITTTTVTQHELTGFMTAYEYNITVRGINCGSEEGRESEPLTITTQGTYTFNWNEVYKYTTEQTWNCFNTWSWRTIHVNICDWPNVFCELQTCGLAPKYFYGWNALFFADTLHMQQLCERHRYQHEYEYTQS